jgi:RND family efflux transporter MFP subunit
MLLHTFIGAISFALFLSTAAAQQAPQVDTKSLATGECVVVPARSWDVSAEVSNQITKIHFVRGQQVKKGDLLVEMDTFFKKLDIELAEVALMRANAALTQAEENLQRQTKLKDRQVSSVVGFRDAEIAAELARADVRDFELRLKKAKGLLEVQTIYAPFGGLMSEPRYRDNANVDITDGTEIGILVQLDPIHVLAREPFTDSTLNRLQGKESVEELTEQFSARLILPNGEVYPHEGRAVSIAFDVDQETGLTSFLLEFPNPRAILRPGLKVQVINRFEQR